MEEFRRRAARIAQDDYWEPRLTARHDAHAPPAGSRPSDTCTVRRGMAHGATRAHGTHARVRLGRACG